jgi:nucleoid-associated protein YgaU
MGLVQQAVIDFDEEIQAPWRPRLVAVAGGREANADGIADGMRPRRPHSSGRSSARVGVCRPLDALPQVPARRVAARGGVATGEVRPAEMRRPGLGSASVRRRTGRGVRLTRRARLLAAVLTLALGVAIGSWLGPLLAGGGGDLQLAGVESVVVQPGDTLWSIAVEVAGAADVREVVDRIQQLNHLQGTVLVPGQVLELP